MRFQKAGILGGMGPQATILLQERLLHAGSAQDDVVHIPLLIDMNPQVPSRIKCLLEKGTIDPAPVLVEMAKRLEAAGADVLAMPCNTAHAFADEIEQASEVPFLHMPRLAAAEVASHVAPGGCVGILASPATEKIKLFTNSLAPFGLSVCYPREQEPLLDAIKQIKAKGVTAQAVEALRENARWLERNGAQAIMIGCSEFSLLSDKIIASVPVIDTLDVLTRHLAMFALDQYPDRSVAAAV